MIAGKCFRIDHRLQLGPRPPFASLWRESRYRRIQPYALPMTLRWSVTLCWQQSGLKTGFETYDKRN